MAERILIIDDDPFSLLIYSRLLKEAGFDVMRTLNADFLFRETGVGKIDLLIIDEQLLTNGHDFIKKIKSKYPDICILLITPGNEIKDYPEVENTLPKLGSVEHIKERVMKILGSTSIS